MREPGDRTAELKTANGKLEIARGDFCDAFEQDKERLFSSRQCWYCRYADFHLDKPKALDVGICYWPEKIIK